MCHDVKQFSSAETIVNYKLGTSANVIRIKEALENKEIIDSRRNFMFFIMTSFIFYFGITLSINKYFNSYYR